MTPTEYKAHRLRADITPKQLADYLDVTPSTVHSRENGHSRITKEAEIAISTLSDENLMELVNCWKKRAIDKFAEAKAASYEMTQALITHGAMCYFTAAKELEEVVRSKQYNDSRRIESETLFPYGNICPKCKDVNFPFDCRIDPELRNDSSCNLKTKPVDD